MPLDPSISLQAGQGVPAMVNPLAQFGQAASISNALAQNKLLGVNTQNAQLQSRNIGLQGDQQAQALGASGNAQIGNMAMSIATLPDAQLIPAAHQGVQTLVDSKVITPQQGQSFIDVMAQTQDPTHLRQMLTVFGKRNLGPDSQFTQTFGSPTAINTGGNIVQGVTAPASQGGGFSPSTSVQTTLTPQDLQPYTMGPTPQQDIGNRLSGASPISLPQPNGTSRTFTAGQVAGTSNPFGTGAYPAGQPVGQTAPLGASQEADQSVGALSSDRQATAGAPTRMYQLQSALKALQNTTTGKGSETLNSARSLLQTYGVTSADADKIKNYDEANKYLTGYAMNAANSFGAATDSKLASALSANASTHISNLAAQDVVRANLGLERMGIASQDAFAKSGLPGNQYLAFKQQWASQHDPSVFVMNEMPPDKVLSMVQGMKPAQRALLQQQYNDAVKNGWVDPIGGQNGAR